MAVTLEFNPSNYSERVLRLIMARAEQWKCSPGEALTRLLENAAARGGFPPSSPDTTELSKAA